MGVKERLIEYLKHINISQKDFAKEVGVSFGYVNAIRVSIQPKTLHKIAVRFPDLNTGWLLTGEGEMLRSAPVPALKDEGYKDRYISMLEDRVEEQKMTIERFGKCIDMLKESGAGPLKTGSG